ncbi:hypothetical protein Poli38472_010024 [Pythium oligandrum]|uniref:Uncharacterized protein n=1 Tax=Pythium oligandrum TaxID=41045 RepID=A0A8K1C8L2_PYTOL|nr:hypothetical protein Poli38472_010024 [Pythium oligandrum]|eukprot:TMW58465.1 hypothetical protein Poli38472_010024 [Pythium oligandrum]
MGAEASYVRQDLVSPAQPVAAINQSLCHTRVISVLIRQDAVYHPTRGVVYEIGENEKDQNDKGPLLFNLTSVDGKDKDDRVLKDDDGTPIVYLTERNRVVMRGFTLTRDADGQDVVFEVKRKHLSTSPVRAQFKDLNSGRMCEMGAAVLEKPHGITALLWLDVGDGANKKLPVGRLYFPSDYHKDAHVVRFLGEHHKGYDDGYDEDYQLDIMPGVDAGLAVLVAMVTAAAADPKRRHGGQDAPVKQEPE